MLQDKKRETDELRAAHASALAAQQQQAQAAFEAERMKGTKHVQDVESKLAAERAAALKQLEDKLTAMHEGATKV